MRNLQLGFKMFSNEIEKFGNDAVKFFANEDCAYIELFVYPGDMQYLEDWEKFKERHDIPFTIHAPHAVQRMNLADKDQLDYNKMVFAQVNTYLNALDAKYVIVHPGKEHNIKETVRQLNIINPQKMVIENKPYISKKNLKRTYRGATIEEIKYVRENHPCGFCLDIAHNFCTANELGINPYEYLAKFQELKPTCYHISGNLENSKIDLHTHFDKCDWDLNKIFQIIDVTKNITVETRHPQDTEVQSFINDVNILKK